jgi:membrane-bound serine protease (ClpP class)
MKKSNRIFSLLFPALLCGPAGDMHAQEMDSPAPAGATWLLEVDDAIGPAVSDYLVRSISAAEAAEAGLIVIEMDTPGGLDTAMRDIIQAILASGVPVVTYVSPKGARAASAGTYILYASHIAAMAPATNLGAATPVQIGMPSLPAGESGDGEQASAPEPDAMEKKIVNDAVAYIHGLAELRGRNTEWAEEAVREGASLSSTEALEQGVIDIIAADLGELLAMLDGRAVDMGGETRTLSTANVPIQAAGPDWRTRFLKVITNPNLVLILGMIGFYGIILEFYNPGVGVPGVVGVICLILAGFGLQMLPVNYAGLALLILGVAMIIAEASMPSFGVFGVGGIISFIFGSIMLFDTNIDAFQVGVPIIAAVAVVSAGFLYFTIHITMKMRKQPVVSGAGMMIGKTGEAMENFSGEGMVRVQGELWDARTSIPVRKGDLVTVTSIKGLHLNVEKTET